MRYLIILLLLSSCYGPKKADKQLSKALHRYPDKVATIARDSFPCIPVTDTVTVSDTLSEFIEVIIPCDTLILTDSVWTKIVQNKYITLPQKVITRTITLPAIRDSASVFLCESKLRKSAQTITSLEKKVTRKTWELWIWRIIATVMIVWQIAKIYFKLKK